MDEATAKLIDERGIWLSAQAFPDELANAFPEGSQKRAKAFEVFAGTTRPSRWQKVQTQTAWGTDSLFSPRLARRQGELLTKFTRWYGPNDIS